VAKLEQLSLDLVIAPMRILFRQTHNHSFKFRRYTEPAWISFSSKGPFATHQFSMSAKDCFRLEDQEELMEMLARTICGLIELSGQGC
jgi:hypothetical protein